MSRAMVLALCLLAVSVPADAGQYCWEHVPAHEPLPPYLRPAGPDAEVKLNCVQRAERSISCVVAEETPVGWGYGARAERLTRQYRTCEGVAYPDTISLTIRFVNPTTPDPSLSSAP